MKGFLNKVSNSRSSQDQKNPQQFIDPVALEEIIKKQLIEKNPRLLADKALLEETIRKTLEKTFKERNLQLKPQKNEANSLPKNSQSKTEAQTLDLLDIGIVKEENKLNIAKPVQIEPKNAPILIENRDLLEERKNEVEQTQQILSTELMKPPKVEKIEKEKINEEIKVKYSFLLQPYQFKFELSREVLANLHKKLCENDEKKFIEIDKEFILKVLENLEYLRKCQSEDRELEEKYKYTVKDYNKMQERLQNQEELLKKIEFTYHEKINEIEYSFQEKINSYLIENKNLKNIIEKNERNLTVQAESFKEEALQYQESLKQKQNVFFNFFLKQNFFRILRKKNKKMSNLKRRFQILKIKSFILKKSLKIIKKLREMKN